MDYPHWSAEKTLQYKGRWEALSRISSSSDSGSSSSEADDNEQGKSISGVSLSRLKSSGLLPSAANPLVEKIAQAGSTPLEYDNIYEGFSHLLSTQPDNPPPERLIRHLDGERNRRSYYNEVEIPKSGGDARELSLPHDPLKWVQRSLLLVLTHLFPRHKCAHGFERGKSIITHAKQHVDKRHVYSVDIKEFFPSITRNRIFGMFRSYPFYVSKPVARYLANLVTYEGELPQGAPTSPILANLLCRKLDSRLFKWTRGKGYVYSRYADDLTFSTNKQEFPERDRQFIDEIIRDEGFEVNDEKRELQSYYERQKVTGLIVNEKLNLPREKIRGLRALLHNVEVFGWRSQVSRACFFTGDKYEQWSQYVTGEKKKQTLKKIDQKQREERLLLNPSAELTHVKDVSDLQQVAKGKIEFLGSVRGKDDPIYQRMSRKLKDLIDRYESFREKQEEGQKYSEERRSEEERVLSELGSGRFAKESSHYKQLSDWLREQVDTNELRERLGDWRDHSLEIGGLLDRTADKDRSEWIGEAKKIAHALDTSPGETALFFRQFDDDKGFRGLLHNPQTIAEEPEAILGACEETFERYRLPNGLKADTERLLDECSEWMEAHEGEHPWPAKKDTLLRPYKEKTQFKAKPGADLIGRLKNRTEDYQREFGTQIRFHAEMGKTFRAHIPSVLPPITQLIRSMAEHTFTEEVHIDIDRMDGDQSKKVVLKIWDEGGKVYGEPELNVQFTGDTRRALYNKTNDSGLRGYARWTFAAPFDGDDAYEFDVMNNERRKLKRDIPGVMHRITFCK